MPYKTKEARLEHARINRERLRVARNEWRRKNIEHCREVDRKRDRKPYNRLWRIKNLAHVKAKKAKWNAENPEKVRAMKREYYHKNRERLLAKVKASYHNNKAEWYARVRDWQARNPDKMKAYQEKWANDNRQSIRARNRKYASLKYAENPQKFIVKAMIQNIKFKDKIQARRRARLINRKAEDRALNQKRIEIQLGATVGDPKQIVRVITDLKCSKETVCYYCGVSLYSKPIHIDHIIPLSRGGKHSIENLCASCPPCNLSKHDKTPKEFSAWKETTGKLYNQHKEALLHF